MDSRDIAELTGKEHRNVIRDINTYLGSLPGGVLRFEQSYLNSQNKEQPCYKLPFEETMILISGYSVELRAKIVRQWNQYRKEAEEGAFPVPKTFAEALRLAADQHEQIEQKNAKIALDAPKVEAFDSLMRSEDSISITDAAKHFGLAPRTMVFPFLRECGYLTKKSLPTSSAEQAGFLALREAPCADGQFREQAVVLKSMLDAWRRILVPRIQRWVTQDTLGLIQE